MKLIPRSLYGQILLALMVGLVAVQVLGAWLMLDDRARLADRLLGAHAAQRIAGIISLLDAASAEERIRLVHALDVPPTRISLDEPWQAEPGETSSEAEGFADALARELERPFALQVLSIHRAPHGGPRGEWAEWRRYREGPPVAPGGALAQARTDNAEATAPARRPGHGRRPVLLVVAQAKLAGGAVVTFRHVLPEPPAGWPVRVLIWLALMGITVVLLAGWAVRRLTRPLSALGAAATGLGQNLDQAPLPEAGPTEVSRAARAFNAMQGELKRVLQTRGQALAAVSHDLRLPITRLRLRLEKLHNPQLKSAIEGDLAEMDEMIGNTIEYLRAGSPKEKLAKLDLDALLESLVEDMQPLGATVRLHGAAREPLRARPQALRRCLGNLLENARRYGAGEIDVTVREVGCTVEVRIEDRGPGIPEAERERVFEPFVRLESSRAKHSGGTGLGLAIARAIARSHGGEILLGARPGGGLAVILSLPRTTAVPVSEALEGTTSP